MANYAIDAKSLTEGTNVLVRGKTAFSRLTRLIDGQALIDSDRRKVQNGMNAVGKPHTTITITQAEVQSADPANPTVEEQFVAERRYTSKKNPDTGLNYSIDSKGSNLPVIAIPSEKGDGTFDQDLSGRELAQGVDVTLVLRVFKPKNFANRGLALEQVIVNETPRYYGGGGVSTEDLKAHGIVFNAPPRAVAAADASPVGDAPEPVGSDIEDGLAFPSPQPTAAPVQAAAPAPAPAAAPVEETTEEKLARLEALERQVTAQQDAGSAVGAPGSASPWNGSAAQGGITYQG